MSLIDGRELPDRTLLESDICIVGAGAAGITLARRLARAGREVLLVESGGLTAEANTQALYELESTGYPQRPGYMSRLRCFGGSCNLWAGRSMRLDESDFAPRSWVSYSGWPLPYAEVARYYPEAARILRLPELPAVGEGFFERRFSAAEGALFGHPALVPTASLWAPRPMRFGAAYFRELRDAARVRLLLNTSATHLQLDETGARMDSMRLVTLEGRQFTVRAATFVLACGGIENARLLLLARDRQPEGIGNGHDRVGRFFMDHPRAVLGRVHVAAGQRLPLLRGRPVAQGKFQLGVGLAPEAQRREGLLNHYATLELESSGYTEAGYQALVQTMKVLLRKGHAGRRWDFSQARLKDLPEMIYLLSPRELMPHALYRAYVAARDLLPRRAAPQTYVVVYFCEQPPDPASRVTLTDPVDALGLPRARFHWHIGPEVAASVLRLQSLLSEAFARGGVGRLEPGNQDIAYTDASHHMGTTRMAATPREGVVDTDCRVHGVENLYLAGSSVFPCAGYANPTLTIVALALRLAERLGLRRMS